MAAHVDVDSRLPTYFISHGGGPWPWLVDQMPGDYTALTESLRSIPAELGSAPRAILVVSGHWETPQFTVQTSPNPPMLYDYGGFPEFTYRLEYPAPGSPEVAAQVVELLGASGIGCGEDPDRGFDHGVFVPLFVAYPEADVPVVQLSIRNGHDPAVHLDAGRALAPLRDDGVLILGSGLTYHNLSDFGPSAAHVSEQFDEWLAATLLGTTGEARSRQLEQWEAAPMARRAHPAADHLIPLMVAAGAAEDDPATRIYHDRRFMDAVTSSSYRFGVTPG